jgi:hypothetical protein
MVCCSGWLYDSGWVCGWLETGLLLFGHDQTIVVGDSQTVLFILVQDHYFPPATEQFGAGDGMCL